ncbi:MAG: CHAT domain-containing protein [Thermoanaerobaculia bacterium]
MLKPRVLACALGLSISLVGCRRSGVQGCLDLTASHRYAAAAKRCGEVYYAAGRDPRAGAAAAQSHYALRHEDEVLTWVDRLAREKRVSPGVWSLAASVQERQGRLEEAERDYRRDVAVCRAAGDHARAADILYRLFHLSWGRSGYRATYLLASESLREAVESRDPKLQAFAVQAVYTALFEVGDLDGARRALDAAAPWIAGLDRQTQARFLNNRGTVLAAQGRPALARREFERALELGAGGTHELFRAVQLNLTEVLLDLGETGRAADHLAEAWKHVEPGRPPADSLFDYQVRIDLARGDLARAGRDLAAALGNEPDPEWAWDLEYRRGLLAEARGDLRTAESAYEKSVGIVEEMRRSLAFDDLKSWLLDRKREPFEALFRLRARSGRAREALEVADRAQARTFLDAFLQGSSSAGAPLERLEGLGSLLPAMSQSPVAAPQPIGQVLKAFGDRHGLIYFEAADDLWRIVVAGGKVRLQPVAVRAPEVRRLAEEFLAHPEDARRAERLGELLLPPGSLPERGRTVYVAADGILGNLPFAALRREGRYLVEDRPLVSVPSLSALAALEKPRGEAAESSLVLADPRGDLPAAMAEGRDVARLLGCPVRTGREATAGEMRRASRARALHLATHAGLGPRGSWLELAGGQVSASEIVAGRIGPRLVVLASCASGARPGRQMWGSLGASFLAAGSRSVLASLWSVEDAPTRELILGFYSEGGTSDPAGALARAQRVAIGRGLSPKIWAPFVLLGSDRPLDEAP